MRDKIALYGMEFYGKHGVLPEEKALGQKFIVDVELYLSLQQAGETDYLDKTINYADVFEMVRNIVQGKTYNLIEALAENIAQEILKLYSTERVMVRVKKPQAPIAGSFDYVGVEIVRGL